MNYSPWRSQREEKETDREWQIAAFPARHEWTALTEMQDAGLAETTWSMQMAIKAALGNEHFTGDACDECSNFSPLFFVCLYCWISLIPQKLRCRFSSWKVAQAFFASNLSLEPPLGQPAFSWGVPFPMTRQSRTPGLGLMDLKAKMAGLASENQDGCTSLNIHWLIIIWLILSVTGSTIMKQDIDAQLQVDVGPALSLLNQLLFSELPAAEKNVKT